MPDCEPTHIFVYGTLMSAATGSLGRDMRLRLRREARSAGSATVQGVLYDLGTYPGLVRSADPSDRVHGEVLALIDPAATLPWLDDYEGVGRGQASAGEYLRVVEHARLASGASLEIWLYLLQRPLRGLPRIPGGRWTG
jgi:gamma-glutamylcyclotransferase (GGCT)/AIG2-like uncharacterized protein YtfP